MRYKHLKPSARSIIVLPMMQHWKRESVETITNQVTYSINNGRRMKTIAVTLGIVSFLLIVLWHGIVGVNPSLAGAAALFIYGILFYFYNLFGWTLPMLRRLDGIPNIHGQWKGTIGFHGEAPCEARLKIIQNWSEIGFELASDVLTARATMARMNLADPTSIHVAWNYLTSSTDPKDTKVHGSIQTTMDAQHKSLSGGFFDDCGRQGELSFQALD